MPKKNEENFVVPYGYLVELHGGTIGMGFTGGPYDLSKESDCYVDVYENLDIGRSQDTEHTRKVGSFCINQATEMNIAEFFESLRLGIKASVEKNCAKRASQFTET